ncbi:hypothetical protein GMES_4095 [Paraglaciecola mesophila KMM 241]|uniref:Uncharacterized protein n=1 Tax=Paraglaciecola mesophila KMM 241 TaxID=1128912 RepID=K6ZBM9_9ALTE|nr:hypothetical protein GMES_4095 [Paraglaciecola mesophila KMM 241]
MLAACTQHEIAQFALRLGTPFRAQETQYRQLIFDICYRISIDYSPAKAL